MQRDTSVRRRPAGALPAGPRGRCPRSGRASTHRGSGRQAPRAPGEICYRPRPRTSEGTPSRWCPPLAHPAKGPPMASAAPKIPSGGEPITLRNGRLEVPEHPILPFIEGDGTGPDIWRASQYVFDEAVKKVYSGKRKIAWMEVYAGGDGRDQNPLPRNFGNRNQAGLARGLLTPDSRRAGIRHQP